MRFFLLPFLPAVLAAQTYVDVRVVDSVSGAPLAGVYVEGQAENAPLTDAAGRLRFPVHDKQVNLSAVGSGYLRAWGNLTIETGKPVPEMLIHLVPQAVIAGHVFDENGLPVRGALVSALQSREINGQSQLRPWRGSVVTNELGEYRIAEMPAGRYYLGVTPEKLAEWNPRYTSRLYPDETDVDHAELMELRAGEERGRDFRLTPIDGVTVSGRVVGTAKFPGRLFLESPEFPDYSVPVIMAGDWFSATHVPPGNYTLRTWRGFSPPRVGEPIGNLTLRVGKADVRDLVLEVHPVEARDISGTVVFQGHTKPVPVAITLRSNYAENTRSTVSNADGSFVIRDVLPCDNCFLDVRPQQTAGSPPSDAGSIIEQLGTRDVMLQNFEIGAASPGTFKITMASPVAKLSGKLLDEAGRPLNDARILFLSQAGHIRSYGYTKEDGSIDATIRTAGEHRVFVIRSAQGFDTFRDLLFLQAHENDFPLVKIVEGANPPLALRMSAQ